MCFSPEADFVSGAVIGLVGVASLREARHPREVPLAALPLAFALHQITEGFVWLGLEGHVARSVSDAAMYGYLLYAWVVLPFLAPLAIFFVEPDPRRRRWMSLLVAIGAVVGVRLLLALTQGGVSAHITGHTIDYRGVGGLGDLVTALYIVATCGSFLLSSQRRIVWFGVANVVAVATIVWVQSEGLTSLWCLWAGIVSVLIYLQLRDWRDAEEAERALT
jgi:hypothetical protein